MDGIVIVLLPIIEQAQEGLNPNAPPGENTNTEYISPVLMYSLKPPLKGAKLKKESARC